MQTVLIVVSLLTLAVCVGLILFSARRQDRSKAVYFTVLVTALSYYLIGYPIGMLSETADAAFAALRMMNAGIPLIAPFFLLSVLSLFQQRTIKRWMMPTALLYGLCFFVTILFNDRHWLYYASITMVQDAAALPYAKMAPGPLYIVQQVVSFACVFSAYFVLFRCYIKGTDKSRSQMRLIALGTLIALSANILNFTGVLPAGLDLTPIAMTAALAVFALNLQRYRLLDLVPVASSAAVESMEDAVVVLDMNRGYQYSNRAARKLLPELASLHGTERMESMASWPAELKQHEGQGEVTFLREGSGGEARHFRAHITAIDGGGMDSFIGWSYVIRDITDTRQLMQQLEEMATIDPLTGVYNRRQFLTMVNRELEIAARLNLKTALIMYDLDYFKDVNDTYGHLAGDYVLWAMAQTIKNQLRPYDILARYGGEEFVIFSTAGDSLDLNAFAERLRQAVERAEYVFEGTKILVTASFGAVVLPPNTQFQDAMRAVDIAMYQAKMRGRNQVALASLDTPTDA